MTDPAANDPSAPPGSVHERVEAADSGSPRDVVRAATSALQVAPAWQVWGALLIVYVVWGSTYLGIRIVVESMPPMFTIGIRFAAAALIMGVILMVRHGPAVLRVSRSQLLGAMLIGGLLLGLGNGGVVLGERDVPSGLAALIVGVVPLVVLIIRRSMGERIDRIQVVGVTGGLLGLVILIAPLGLSGAVKPLGLGLLLASTVAWSYGSVLSRRVRLPRDPFVSTFYQFLAGCLFGFAIAVVTGETAQLDPGTWSIRSIIALAYLVIFGSLIAFSAFTWLLQHAPVTRITTYAYVNPVVAVALGFFVLGEAITPPMLVGAVLILSSVAIIVRLQRPPRPVPEVS